MWEKDININEVREIRTRTCVYFGCGAINKISEIAKDFKSKGLDKVVVMSGKNAYKATGELVALCINKGLTLETLPLEEYKAVCDIFDEGVFDAINLDKCVNDRTSLGGPAPQNVLSQVKRVKLLNK